MNVSDFTDPKLRPIINESFVSRFETGKEVLVRGANIHPRYFYNFSLADLLVGFEACPVVTITVDKKPGQDFAVVIIEGEPHNEE